MKIASIYRKFHHFGKTSLSLGNTLSESFRIFHLAALKPSLVHRGIGMNDPTTEIHLKIRQSGSAIDVAVRDNTLDIQTLLEIFGSDNLDPLPYCKSPPAIIYDLGANIGISTLYLVNAFPDAQVLAFEPEPGNHEIARQNLSGFPNARLLKRAVADKRGAMNFECGTDIRGGRLVGSSVDADTNLQTVEVWSIAEMIDTEGLPCPDYLKIDVEGAELAVLEGMGAHINSVKVMQIETHSEELHNSCRNFLNETDLDLVRDQYHGAFGILWAVHK